MKRRQSYCPARSQGEERAALPRRPASGRTYVAISSRRYLGCKRKLLPQIRQVVQENCPQVGTVMDVFAGTGVVGQLFNTPRRRVIVNDFLISNATVLTAYFQATRADRREIEDVIEYLSQLKPQLPNYYSEHFGDRFFTVQAAGLIGTIRDAIDALALRPVVKAAAIASLLYAADACALTCGHFDAYRGLKDRPRPFVLRLPAVAYEANGNNEVYCRDGNELAREREVDLLYVDPPYNKRQYGTLYHVLDTITANDKPPLRGKTRKPSRKRRPFSLYCTDRAVEAFRDLILKCRAKHIVVSYNNMRSGGANSNAIMDPGTIEAVLSERGQVKTYSFSFPSFTARRTLLAGHREYLFYVRVR